MTAALESHAPGRTRARLSLADVAAPMLLDLEEQRADGFTVARSLPFLGLGREVRDEQGRLAHIESVYVELESDTPRLVMDLAYAAIPGRDLTLSYETHIPGPPRLPSAAPALAAREGTLLFVTPRIAQGEERLSSAPVMMYEDADALKDGLASIGRGLFTAGCASLSLSWRGFVAGVRLLGRVTRRAWLASRHLGATYADAPATPVAPAH